MKEILDQIQNLIGQEKEIDVNKLKEIQMQFIKNDLKKNHCVEGYIGDFPTFLEPVHLGDKVEIGDDVLIGPNVYIGNNCSIGDYCELVNTIIFDDVKLGENLKLENVIIAKESELNFKNTKLAHCIVKGKADTADNLNKTIF